MSAPAYTWVCHSCARSNPPDISECGHCGFPAKASAREIDAAKTGAPTTVITGLGGYILLVIVAAPILKLLQAGAMESPIWLLPTVLLLCLVAWTKSALEKK